VKSRKKQTKTSQWSDVSPVQVRDFFLISGTSNTRKASRNDLAHFSAWLNLKDADGNHISRHDESEAAVKYLCELPAGAAAILLANYRQSMMDIRTPANTVRRRIGSILALLKKARECGVIGWSVKVKLPPATTARDTSGPGREKVEAMISACRGRGDAKGFRDAAIVELLAWSGLRSGELVGLDAADVDYEALTVAVNVKRRWDSEVVNVPQRTILTIQSWLSYRGNEDGPLFQSFTGRARLTAKRLTYRGLYDLIVGVGRSVGVKCRPHGLRHTGITECLILNRGDLIEGLKFSRHKDPRTILGYIDNMRGGSRAMVEMVASGIHANPRLPRTVDNK
jgi:integrase/recombinase XerC